MPPERTSGQPLSWSTKTNHSLSKRFVQFTLPAADLAVSVELKSMLVVDPKLAVLFTMRHHRGFYNINNSDHTEGDRLVSCMLVKNVFKVETLRTFESGATPSCLWSPRARRTLWRLMGGVCHSFLKRCKSLNTGPVSLLSLWTTVHDEQRSFSQFGLCQLVMLSLSLVLSASPVLIFHLDRVT